MAKKTKVEISPHAEQDQFADGSEYAAFLKEKAKKKTTQKEDK
jgi:hypothetical protein